MQDLSFDAGDPVFTMGEDRFSLVIYTFENRYGLDLDQCRSVTGSDGSTRLLCTGLTWAGGQEKAEGRASLTVQPSGTADRSQTIAIDVCVPGKRIRCVKLTVHHIERGAVLNLRESPEREIPVGGLLLRYPDGWRGLYTPLIVLRGNDGCRFFRSLDTEVREKRFALVPCRNDPAFLDVELLFEERASEMTDRVSIPLWEVGVCSTAEAILNEHAAHLERAFGLDRWEERTDMPDWVRDIALVVALHGQHWTGRIFLDYEAMGRTLEWLAARIDGRHILAYLPGWEGRYYWQYGDYRPDERMGGGDGFRRLIERAHDLGVRIVPMFGMNYANRGLPNFEQWGAPALTGPASGVPLGAGGVDWDGSRHYDHSWGAMLNPGAPTWRNHLAGQIEELAERYRFDGVFLDISAVWLNDPRYDTYAGVCALVRRLRERRPQLLIAGEGWYDAIGSVLPLTQSGHTDGVLHWHDALPMPSLFDAYQRCFAHLCLGAPDSNSTGVHELGYNSITSTPLRKGVLPTLSVVDSAPETSNGAIEQTIFAARQYAERFLRPLC